MWKIIFVTDHADGVERCESTLKIISKRLKINPVFLTDQPLKMYQATPFPKTGFVRRISAFNPRIVVFDLKYPLKDKQYKALKNLGIKLINHNHYQANNLFDVNLLMFRLFGGEKPGYFEGAEYTALHREFYKNGIKIRRHARRVIINDINKKYWTGLFKDTDATLTFVNKITSDKIKSHDLSIMPADYSAIQSLATGIPTLLFARSEVEDKVAANLVNTNATVHLGFIFGQKPCDVKKKIVKILCGFQKRKNLSYAAKCLVNRKTWDNLHKIFKKTLEG